MNRKERRATKQPPQKPARQEVIDETLAALGEGLRYQRAGLLQDAATCFARAIGLTPDLAEAHYNLGIVLGSLGRHDEAITAYRRAIALKPSLGQAHFNLGNALRDVGQSDEALAAYERALSALPEDLDVLNNMGVVLRKLGRHDEALAIYRRALVATPKEPSLHTNLGLALRDLGRLEESAAAQRRAIALDPGFATAHASLGAVLRELGQLAEAAASYREAIALKPDDAAAHCDLGVALKEAGRLEEAVASFRLAITLDEELAAAYYGLISALTQLRRYAEVAECCERMLALLPSVDAIFPTLFMARRHLCDWREFAASEERCRALFRSGDPQVTPFASLALSSSAEEQLLCARAWAAERARDVVPLPPPAPRVRDKLRLGYVSYDFRDHAVAVLTAELFECHDHRSFEVTAYSIGPDSQSAIRERLRRSFDRFIDIRALSDAEAAQRIRDDGIDILVDLTGFTTGSRPGIFARRPAPIQVNFIGYPGSMGAAFIDYIIADAVTVPPWMQLFFDERVVYLPDCFQPNDAKRADVERPPSRAECGLPETGFVFCCFNNAYKITPAFFDIWMRMLARIEGSVLWLLGEGPIHQANLEREAAARGIDPTRLVFAPRLGLPAHLARHRLADLFLDTLPYNAHTTASDALWACLPVLTCIGETFVGRVASSLLQASNLPDLVTHSLAEYEALGLRLASDPAELAGLRLKLEANRHTAALFDTPRFARNLETAFEQMWNRWMAGRAPESFAVNSAPGSTWRQFVSKPVVVLEPAGNPYRI